MSYGVMASKAAQVQVDEVTPAGPTDDLTDGPTDGPTDGSTDGSLDAAVEAVAQRRWRARRNGPALWGSGRLTLTSLHLTFVPASGSSGVPALTLVLADIIAIEGATGRGNKSVTFRTDEVAKIAITARTESSPSRRMRSRTETESASRSGRP